MNGIFQRLEKKLNLEKREGGISPIEIASLPPNLRKLMRMLVREVQIYYVDLLPKIAALPEKDRLSQAELDASLKELARQGWLIMRGEGERVNYSVNFRRRPGSQVAQGIWGSLDDKIAAQKARLAAEQAAEQDKADGA